jgi:hypothetical protein
MLKYLYLLVNEGEDGGDPLDWWVFNMEAHLLTVFNWMEWERELYAIGIEDVDRADTNGN